MSLFGEGDCLEKRSLFSKEECCLQNNSINLILLQTVPPCNQIKFNNNTELRTRSLLATKNYLCTLSQLLWITETNTQGAAH